MTPSAPYPTTHRTARLAAGGAALLNPATRVATIVALGLLIAGALATALGASQPPDISGSWAMDKELSEDPMEKMRERRDGGMRPVGMGGGGRGGAMGGGRGGGMGGGGRGGGWGGGPGGGQGPGQSREEMRQRMEELRASLERLEIAQTADGVRITYADGRQQVLTTDDKKSAIDTPFGEGTIRAKWRNDGGLAVKTRDERRKTTETYYVTNDGRMLTVLVEMEGQGPMGSTSYKRIYRPAELEEAAPEMESEAEPEPAVG